MMSSPVAGIHPHRDTFTIAVIDANGVDLTDDTFDNSSRGYIAAIEVLTAHGVEGSVSSLGELGITCRGRTGGGRLRCS